MKINFQCLLLSGLVRIMIAHGKIFSDMPFLTRNLFSHSTAKYTILVISKLCKYLNGVVLTAHIVLYFTVWAIF